MCYGYILQWFFIGALSTLRIIHIDGVGNQYTPFLHFNHSSNSRMTITVIMVIDLHSPQFKESGAEMNCNPSNAIV